MVTPVSLCISAVLVLSFTTAVQATNNNNAHLATTIATHTTTIAQQTATITDATLVGICVNASNPKANEVWLTTGSVEGFSSPRYPNSYGSGDSREWVFCAVSSSDQILITCSDFHVGGFFFGCNDDTLSFTNLDSSASEYCTTKGPQLVRTTARGTKATFTTSTSTTYRGFACTARAVRETDCRSAEDRASYEVWLENGISETFTSPNYPSRYGKGDSKRWVFCAVDSTDNIQVSCSEFSVGGFFVACTNDVFAVSNAESNGKFCSTNAPKFVDTTGRGTEVTLLTGSPFRSPGFSCTATALRALCRDPSDRASNEKWLENGQVESFSSPGHPASRYGRGDNKEWRFCAVDAADRIEVSCHAFQVGSALLGCLDDTLTISNVDSKNEFCGTAGPQSVKTNERGTIIRLHALTKGLYKGFNCTAKAVRHAICLNASKPAENEVWLSAGNSEIFTSPNYPSNYDKRDSRDWVFCAAQDSVKISITCSDFQVGGRYAFCLDERIDRREAACDELQVGAAAFGCVDDTLKISNGASTTEYCGFARLQSVTSNERGMRIALDASTGAIYKGFNCTATAVRNAICMNASNPAEDEVWLEAGVSKVFTSPNYPLKYGTKDSKDWVFCAVQDSGRISITCDDFQVGRKFIVCLDDSMTISNTGPGFSSYCGSEGPDTVVTTQRGTTVSLSASSAFYYTGFNCTATAVGRATFT